MAADSTVRNGVAVITLNNPPVNGLGLATREGVMAALATALADPQVHAIVVTGGLRAFSGGADITEFNTPKALQEPMLRTVIEALERSPKPVVAAVNGLAMGGGLELALAAHYRVMARGALLALPEVKLGIMPGAGGTQRLPRAIGVQRALTMILSGDPIKAGAFDGTALVDLLTDGEATEAALEFAGKVATDVTTYGTAPYPRLRDLPLVFAAAADGVTPTEPAAYFAALRADLAKTQRHFPAPPRCVEAVERGLTDGFDAGLRTERAAFLELMATPESRALRHAFFAERAAGKVPGISSKTPVRPIAQVGVVGAGTMGTGIALAFADAGLPVVLLDEQPAALDAALAKIAVFYDERVARGKLAAADAARRVASVTRAASYAGLASADLIVEAVFEQMEVKRSVLQVLDAHAKPGAILASNTSTLNLDQLAAFTRRPQDVVGLHFFSPANVMRLLEVVRGARTLEDTLATALKLAKTLRKTAVVSGVGDGFIGNRMLAPYLAQACWLLEEGALPQQVDAALERFGFAMGPFRVSDLAGNDISWAVRQRRARERPDERQPRIADALCELGRFGQKTSAGWYDYAPGERTPQVSPLVTALVRDTAAATGTPQRQIGDDEIVERLVYALVNEGAQILQEGIALRASDIDLVYLTGYGFPLWRGGPMFYAGARGLPEVVAAIRRYAAGPNGAAWQLAPPLESLAAQGKVFE